jgi:hypothetical protein
MTAPSAARLAAYGMLGLPLAMAALPVYVQVPAYYTSRLGMSLSLAGIVLFAARLVDTAQDPLLGWWIDALARRNTLHRAMGLGAVPCRCDCCTVVATRIGRPVAGGMARGVADRGLSGAQPDQRGVSGLGRPAWRRQHAGTRRGVAKAPVCSVSCWLPRCPHGG